MIIPEPQIVNGLVKYDPSLTGLDLRGHYMRVYQQCAPTLAVLSHQIYVANKKLTILDVGRIALQVGLPVKTTCEFLQYLELLPCGTWERKGYTSRQILEAIHANQA